MEKIREKYEITTKVKQNKRNYIGGTSSNNHYTNDISYH